MSEAVNPLVSYVNRTDDSFSAARPSTREASAPGGGTVQSVQLTSQTWRGFEWAHTLTLFWPKQDNGSQSVFLFLTGDDSPWLDPETAAWLTRETGYGVAILDRIPNQPLFGGRTEDELIAYTFDQYIDTGDPDWPLLLPMTRAAVKAIDVIESICNEQYNQNLHEVVVGGMSKRGWTSWLTGALDDRVTGIVPMVFDMLNMPEQLRHQVEVWGGYSERISDYTERELDRKLKTERGKKLLQMVDPYRYRGQLNLPQFIVSATNDDYWPLTANNLYLDDLPGSFFLRCFPNTGHSMAGQVQAFARTLSAFLLHVTNQRSLPDVSSSFHEEDGAIQCSVSCQHSVPPSGMNIWYAESENMDFRTAHWIASKRQVEEGTTIETVLDKGAPVVGLLGQITYNAAGRKFSLTTRAHVCC